jgi:hypothetical protein
LAGKGPDRNLIARFVQIRSPAPHKLTRFIQEVPGLPPLINGS